MAQAHKIVPSHPFPLILKKQNHGKKWGISTSYLDHSYKVVFHIRGTGAPIGQDYPLIFILKTIPRVDCYIVDDSILDCDIVDVTIQYYI